VIALDTNILVHAHRRDSTLHEPAISAVKNLSESGKPWGICYHCLIEFYGVVTHRRIWSQPSSPSQAMDQIQAWRESPTLRLLLDSGNSLDELGSIVCEARVEGSLIHDARIVACCLDNGVSELWTVDRDFSRFPKIRTRNPLQSVS
jgi:toxin-antitoxin system PIN domain toxin